MCHNILLPSKGSNEWRNIPFLTNKTGWQLLSYLYILGFSSLYNDLMVKYDPAPEEALRLVFQSSLNNDSATFLPAIRRCLKDSPYLRTSGEY